MMRRAMEKDIPAMLVLAKHMHAESSYNYVPFSPSRTEYTIREAIKSTSSRIVLVAEVENEVVAFFGAHAEMYTFSTAVATYDFALYVDKKHRSLGIVVPIIKEYVRWATELKATDIFLGNTASPLEDRVYRLFEKMGFKYAGKIHRMHVVE